MYLSALLSKLKQVKLMKAPTIQKQLAPPTKSLPPKMTIVPSPASLQI